MNAPTLNKWQRDQMRTFALQYRFCCRAPSSLANAIAHRELSFASHPLWQRALRAREAQKKAGCLPVA